jgi:hypothetical protein
MSDTALVDDKAVTTTTTDKAASDKVATDKAAAAATTTTTDVAGDKAGDKSLAAGGEVADAKGAWPEDWRDRMATAASGGDDKAKQKELKRLQRFTDPSAIYGTARELEARFSEGGLIKVPGKDAKPEDIAAFNKALGVPEKVEDYFTDLKLDNGAVLGDADKPIAEGFATAVHEVGATPAVVNRALSWYFNHMEQVASAEAEADDTFRSEAQATLREEWGPGDYKRNVNAIATLFANAPGGVDAKNPEALMSRLLSGRTADGRLIGDDPVINKWLAGLAMDLNPAATITTQGGASVGDRLAEISKFRQENPDKYDQDHKMQAEELKLLEADERMQKRGKAA